MLASPERESFLTTQDFPGRRAWEARCEAVDRRRISKPALLHRLIAGAPRHRGLIVDGSGGPRDFYIELLAATAVRRRPAGARVPILVGECQWKLGESRLDRATARAGLWALDGPRVGYCVLTEWERARFTRTWGVDPRRVFTTPYCHTLSDAELAAPTSREGGVFAGGNSLRDYGPLVLAARDIEERFVLATDLLSEPLPANVTAGPVPERRYFELMRDARVVVVALAGREDRTAGQQTYLNAMALGKPTIVTDSPGVREYVEDGRTGLVVPPRDEAALARALRWVLDPSNAAAVDGMSSAGREAARERFSPDRYTQALLDAADRLIETTS